LLAIDAAVWRGGASISSSIPESGDLPTIVDPFKKDDEDDLREGDAREGDRAGTTPPTPCKEFIDAFLCKVGVDERALRLMELGLLWRGLRGGAFPFGDELELLRCPSVLGDDGAW
jgi:hypothetical protein